MTCFDPELFQRLTAWRRHLHQHPELSLYERETAAFVAGKLRALGIEVTENVGGHGVVGTIRRGGNRSVGLRADMDALPIIEQSGVPHASARPGVMHACGHDGHTVSLLGAAETLLRDTSWSGTVHFVFQPAEEGAGGARAMLADGLFERFPMERIFALHNWPGLPAGTVAVHPGPVMAGGVRIYITLRGHAGHAALPHLTKDPMLAAAHLVVALQSIVARNVDPLESAVVTIATIEGGKASNQIPDSATLSGTARALRPQVMEQLGDGIQRIAAGIGATFGMAVEVDIRQGVAVTINHVAEAEMAAEAALAAGLVLRRDLPAAMTSEDFGWMLLDRPGAYVWVGNGPAEGGRELHNPHYDFNDQIFPATVGWMVEAAKRALRG